METEKNTNTLAALILLHKDRLRKDGPYLSEIQNATRSGTIHGLCTAWEHLTGEDASEEALRAAARGDS